MCFTNLSYRGTVGQEAAPGIELCVSHRLPASVGLLRHAWTWTGHSKREWVCYGDEWRTGVPSRVYSHHNYGKNWMNRYISSFSPRSWGWEAAIQNTHGRWLNMRPIRNLKGTGGMTGACFADNGLPGEILRTAARLNVPHFPRQIITEHLYIYVSLTEVLPNGVISLSGRQDSCWQKQTLGWMISRTPLFTRARSQKMGLSGPAAPWQISLSGLP